MRYVDEYEELTENVRAKTYKGNPFTMRNVVVTQFTGLLDRNGTKIFEGDIVSGFNGELIGRVEWSEEDAGFWVNTSKGGAMATELYLSNYEVIGNVWQNPELVKAAA